MNENTICVLEIKVKVLIRTKYNLLLLVSVAAAYSLIMSVCGKSGTKKKKDDV